MAGMEWTTEKPTKECEYYWAWNRHGARLIYVIKEEWGDEGWLVAFFCDGERDLDEWSHFMGPLLEPEPPTL